MLITYNKRKKHVRVIGDAAVMPKTEAKAIAAGQMLGEHSKKTLQKSIEAHKSSKTITTSTKMLYPPIFYPSLASIYSARIEPIFSDDNTTNSLLTWA